MNSCLTVASAISDADRDALLSRVDGLIESGIAPDDAQRMAASDAMAEIEQEREEMMGLLKEQHPDLFSEPKPGAQATRRKKSEVFGQFESDAPKNAKPSRNTSKGGRVRLTVEELVSAAASMSTWKDWFTRHEQEIKDQFGEQADLFSRLLAATSQASSVPSNVALALKAYRQYHSGDDFTGYLPAVIKNLKRIRMGDDVAGAKISEYDKANRGDPMGMAVDRHIAELMFNTARPNRRQIRVAHRRIQEVAKLLGWEPRQVQSGLWAYNQVRRGKDPEKVQSYDAILKRRSAEISAVRDKLAESQRSIGGIRDSQGFAGRRARGAAVQDRARSRDERGGKPGWIEAAGVDLSDNPSAMSFSGRQPLYASRSVSNAGDIISWAKGQGFKSVLSPEDLHVTTAYSRAPMLSAEAGSTADMVLVEGGKRSVESLGDDGAAVLKFASKDMTERWQQYRDAGASWDYPMYQPHITLTYSPGDIDLSKVEPYAGPILLGPERVSVLDGDAGDNQADGEISTSNRVGRYELGGFGYGRKIIESVQDRYNRWKQAISDIKAQGGTISEDNDFYAAEERYWGKVGAQLEDFKKEVEDWVGEVQDDKLDLASVALYAYAEHAKDRNAWIANIRPSMPDGGSGMTNDQADQYLADAAQSGLEPELKRHTAKLRGWIQGTRQIMLDEGLITQDEFDNWTQGMQSYVPLRGLPPLSNLIDSKKQGTGQGFSVRGKESKTAMGRRSEAKQIIEHVIGDRSLTHIRAGKNEVLRHFLKFVLDNPSPNLWGVSVVESKPVSTVDANGDRIIEERQKVVSDSRVVTLKDGGREVHIEINDERLREQMQNLHIDNINGFFGSLLFVNRILSRLYTSLSPVFTLTNFARDLQTATFGSIDELGFFGAAKVFQKLPAAMKESAAAEFAKTMSPDYQLFRASGGKTGFFDFKDVDDRSKEMMTLARDAERGKADPRVMLKAAFGLVEAANATLENTVRLAAFKAAREMGKTVVESAKITKNLTVNFNRKGAMTPGLSAWFLFFNPAVQGTTRMIEALKNPKVVSVLGAAMGGMFLLAMQNAAMGEDDDGVAWWDKVPDEVKQRNIVIILPPGVQSGEKIPGSPTGNYVKVPMPYGYNFFATVASQVADVVRNSRNAKDGREPGEALMEAFNAFMGSWVPVPELGSAAKGDLKTGVLAAVPDALNPIAQNALNINPFGRPLSPESPQTKHMPDSSRYFSGQAGTLFQRAAQKLNEVTGGSDFRPGKIDLTPGAMENLVRGYMGGPATFTLDILNAFYAKQSLERDQLDLRRLPFAKQVIGVIDEETDRAISYARMDKADEAVSRAKAANDAGDGKELDLMHKESGALIALGDTLQYTRQQLSAMRKAELEVLNDESLSDSQKLAQMKSMNKDRRAVLHGFNAAFNDAVVEQRKQKAGAR